MKALKKIIMYMLILFPVSRGTSVYKAEQWIKRVWNNFTTDKYHSFREKIWAYRHGFMPNDVDTFAINHKNYKEFISERDYYYLYPLNGIYSKWIENRVIARRVYSPFKENLQKLYYQISTNNGVISAYPLDDCVDKSSGIRGLLDLIKSKESVLVCNPEKNEYVSVCCKNEEFSFGKTEGLSENELVDAIIKFNDSAVIAESIETSDEFYNTDFVLGDVIRLIITNIKGNDPSISQGSFYVNFIDGQDASKEGGVDSSEVIYDVNLETGEYHEGISCTGHGSLGDTNREGGIITHWELIKKSVLEIAMHTPQLSFFSVDVVVTEDSFKIINFMDLPKYPIERPFSAQTTEFLIKKLIEKRHLYRNIGRLIKNGADKIRRKTRIIFSTLFFPAGLEPYLSVKWIKAVCKDFFNNKSVKLPTKIWAYRHGFLSYRIPQYGITKENHLDFISDFEYMWLRHINGNYRKLFEDKITIKYIINEFSECFPAYYYHIKTDNGGNVVIPMMDCKSKNKRSFSDIFALVREKSVLALKPDEGSHGDGFYKLSYEDGKYYLNFDEASEEEILKILKKTNNQYLVTEYINNHPQFKEIYDGAVNTIRMLVFKMDGKTPEIGNAYMRFGSKATGAVDNMGAGGMFVKVDIDTGEYGNAKIITHNSIQDCSHHPDSGVLIEGVIPHWDQIKDTILLIAKSIGQMEYFGFDIAVTEDGIKLPEINRFPDYPMIEQLSPLTMKYLLYKLGQKKALYGYDIKPCRKLFHLPKR